MRAKSRRPRGVRTMKWRRSRNGSISSLMVSIATFKVAASASSPVGPPLKTSTRVRK